MFGPYTDLLWIGFGIGNVLGAIAAVVRSRATPLEGKRWASARPVGEPGLSVGIVASIQTHGSLANWHPHLHLLGHRWRIPGGRAAAKDVPFLKRVSTCRRP